MFARALCSDESVLLRLHSAVLFSPIATLVLKNAEYVEMLCLDQPKSTTRAFCLMLCALKLTAWPTG